MPRHPRTGTSRARRPLRLTSARVAALSLLLAAMPGCGKRESRRVEVLAPTPMTSPAPVGAAEPFLAAGGGRVHLSWLARNGAQATFAYATYSQNAWSEPHTIAAGPGMFANWADFPSFAPLADGTFAAHWLEKHGDSKYAYDVDVTRSLDGVNWSAPSHPHRDGTAAEHGFVSIVPEMLGGGTCIWLDGREYEGKEEGAPGVQMQLRTATWLPGGEWSDETVLDPRVCDCCQTATVRTAGGVLVAYRDRSDQEIRDISLVRRDGETWSAPYALGSEGWEIQGCPVNGPALSAVGDRVAAAWFTMARDTAQVKLAFSDDGGATFSRPVRVDEGGTSGRVDVLVLPSGDALVLWLAANAQGKSEIRARRVQASLQLDPSFVVAETSAERASGFPHVVHSDGVLYFAWTESGDPSNVRLATLPVPAAWHASGS